jgi:hypothetical protein
MNADNCMLQAALLHGEPRLAVLPCRHKMLLTEHDRKDMTVDIAVIRRWWTHWTKANIGNTAGAKPEIIVFVADPRYCFRREETEGVVIDGEGRCRPPFPTYAALRKVDSAQRCTP